MDLTIVLENIIEDINILRALQAYLVIFLAIAILGGAKHFKLGTFKWRTLILRTLDDFKYPVISISIWCLAITLDNNETLYSLFQLVTATYIATNIYKAMSLVKVVVSQDAIKDTQKSILEQFSSIESNEERKEVVSQFIDINQAKGAYAQHPSDLAEIVEEEV
jgi:hypothetical protein